jgi:hypothetical protein
MELLQLKMGVLELAAIAQLVVSFFVASFFSCCKPWLNKRLILFDYC